MLASNYGCRGEARTEPAERPVSALSRADVLRGNGSGMSENIHEEPLCDLATLEAAQRCLEDHVLNVVEMLKCRQWAEIEIPASMRAQLVYLREQRDKCVEGYRNLLRREEQE
jgi:hypothetical protein